MHALLDWLDVSGARLLPFAQASLLQSSLLILALGLLERLLRHRLRPAMRYALWLLVPIKLLLPPSLALPTSIAYWLPQSAPLPASPLVAWPADGSVPTGTEPRIPLGHPSPSSATPPLALQLRPEQSRLRPSPAGWLLLLWLAGSTGLLGSIALRTANLRRLVQGASQPACDIDALCDQVRRQLRLPRPLPLLLTDQAHSPALCGLWRPVVLLPRALAHQLAPAQLRAILLHELAHARRGDLWVNTLQTLLQVAWWWHPLVWFANARLRAAREETVDDTVACELGPDADTYPEALLQVAKSALHRPALSLGLIGILESRSGLRRRIERLLSHASPPPPRLGFGALLRVAAIGLLLLPMARGTSSGDRTPTATPLPWSPWSEPAVAAARASGRPVLAHFTADWCLTGQITEHQTLASNTVQTQLALLHTVLLRADATHPNPRVDAVLRQHGRAGLPLTVFYPANPDADAVVLPEVLTPQQVLDAIRPATPPAPPTHPIEPQPNAPPTDPNAASTQAPDLEQLRADLRQAESRLQQLQSPASRRLPFSAELRTRIEDLHLRLARSGDPDSLRFLDRAIDHAALYAEAIARRQGAHAPTTTAQVARLRRLEQIRTEALAANSGSRPTATTLRGYVTDRNLAAQADSWNLPPVPQAEPRLAAGPTLVSYDLDHTTRVTNADGRDRITRAVAFDGPDLIAALEREAGHDLGDDPVAWGEALQGALQARGFRAQPPNAIFIKMHRGLAMLGGPAREVEAATRWFVSVAPVRSRVLIEAHAFLLPRDPDTLRDLTPALGLPPPDLDRTGTNLLTTPQWRLALDTLKAHPEIQSIGRPRILTTLGHAAELATSSPTPDGTNSITLAVLPERDPDGTRIRLEYRIDVTQVVDSGAGRGTSSTPSDPSASSPTFSVNATGYVIQHLTNTVSLADGETLVLFNPADRHPPQVTRFVPLSLRRVLVYLRASFDPPLTPP